MTDPARHGLRRRDEAGYAAVLVGLLASTVFLGMAAIGVDIARWYLEIEKVQKAADAAALAGVTYMPNDLANARATAIKTATQNGYPNSGTTTVTAVQGERPSQLKVTITSQVHNAFGASFGVSDATIVRSAVADYTAPAPMGSPCNTFGNEPPSQIAPAAQPAGTALPTSPFPNCTSQPNFWGALEGPNTDKVQGDRYMNMVCSGTATGGPTYGCAGGKNTEYRSDGYHWAVHVEPEAVNTAITVQVYDPAFMYTQITCGSLYPASSVNNDMNDYTRTDGKLRYGRVSENVGVRRYCPGDYNPGGANSDGTGAPLDPPTTTFVVRHANDTANPRTATPIDGCTRQFVGQKTPPAITQLRQWTDGAKTIKNPAYNLQMAQVFHQWYPLCTFTPDTPGDYYVQVRTNVSPGGTAVSNINPSGLSSPSVIYTGSSAASAQDGNVTAGTGLNAFAMRAVPSDTSKAQYIAMAGNESMPILQNDPSNTVIFNLIRALPGTRGQFISFDFYDAADGSGPGGGTARVLAPADATGSVATGPNIPNCKRTKNNGTYVTAGNCQVNLANNTHDGQLEQMVIPIPNDYDCDPATLGGCWFSVEIRFGGSVTDFTTWNASIGGDPVRLVR